MSEFDMRDPEKVKDKILETELNFDLVLIKERMEESLVLLGEALNLEMSDLVSFYANVRQHVDNEEVRWYDQMCIRFGTINFLS